MLYDPSPGYPYTFFYREETGSIAKILIENSVFIGEVHKRTGLFSKLRKLRENLLLFSDSWNNKIEDKYFETLMLAKKFSNAIESEHFGKI